MILIIFVDTIHWLLTRYPSNKYAPLKADNLFNQII